MTGLSILEFTDNVGLIDGMIGLLPGKKVTDVICGIVPECGESDWQGLMIGDVMIGCYLLFCSLGRPQMSIFLFSRSVVSAPVFSTLQKYDTDMAIVLQP